MNGPLGKATIEINANADKAKATINQTKADVQGLGDSGQEAGKKLESGFEGAGKKLSRLQEGLAKLLIPLALFTGFAKLVDWIGRSRDELDRFDSRLQEIARASTARLNAVQQELAGVSDSEQQVLQVQAAARKEIEAVQKTLEEESLKISQRFKDQSLIYQYVIGGATSGQLRQAAEDRINEINDTTRNLTARLRERQRREQVEEAKKTARAEAEARAKVIESFIGTLDARSDDLQIELLPDREQIKARADAAIAEAERVARVEGTTFDARTNAELRRFTELTREKQRIEQEAFDERMAKEKEAEINKANEVAKRTAEALEREIKPIIDRLNASFGFQGSGLNGVVSAIEKNTRALWRDRGR